MGNVFVRRVGGNFDTAGINIPYEGFRELIGKGTAPTLSMLRKRWNVRLTPRSKHNIYIPADYIPMDEQISLLNKRRDWALVCCRGEMYEFSRLYCCTTSYYFEKTTDAAMFKLKWYGH